MRQTRGQYPGATLGGQAGHYPTPAVKGMSSGVVRENIPILQPNRVAENSRNEAARSTSWITASSSEPSILKRSWMHPKRWKSHDMIDIDMRVRDSSVGTSEDQIGGTWRNLLY